MLNLLVLCVLSTFEKSDMQLGEIHQRESSIKKKWALSFNIYCLVSALCVKSLKTILHPSMARAALC